MSGEREAELNETLEWAAKRIEELTKQVRWASNRIDELTKQSREMEEKASKKADLSENAERVAALLSRGKRVGACAVLRWGTPAQLSQLAEESSELAVAASKLRRERCGAVLVSEELADVLVVALGVLALLDPQMEQHVLSTMEEKLDRLEVRLKQAEQEDE